MTYRDGDRLQIADWCLKLCLLRGRVARPRRGGRPRYDVMPLENRSGLVTCHHHRNSLRNSGTDQIADGGPAEVVRYSARLASFLGCCRPRTAEFPDRAPGSVENPGTKNAALPLQSIRFHLLAFEERARLLGEGKDSSFIVLCHAPEQGAPSQPENRLGVTEVEESRSGV